MFRCVDDLSIFVANFTRAQVCLRDTIWHGEVWWAVCACTVTPRSDTTHTHVAIRAKRAAWVFVPPVPSLLCARSVTTDNPRCRVWTKVGSLSVGCWLQPQGWYRLTIVGFILGPWWCCQPMGWSSWWASACCSGYQLFVVGQEKVGWPVYHWTRRYPNVALPDPQDLSGSNCVNSVKGERQEFVARVAFGISVETTFWTSPWRYDMSQSGNGGASQKRFSGDGNNGAHDSKVWKWLDAGSSCRESLVPWLQTCWGRGYTPCWMAKQCWNWKLSTWRIWLWTVEKKLSSGARRSKRRLAWKIVKNKTTEALQVERDCLCTRCREASTFRRWLEGTCPCAGIVYGASVAPWSCPPHAGAGMLTKSTIVARKITCSFFPLGYWLAIQLQSGWRQGIHYRFLSQSR